MPSLQKTTKNNDFFRGFLCYWSYFFALLSPCMKGFINYVRISECITKKRKINQLKKEQDNAILEKQHIQSSIELSGRKTINNRAFKKWNSSIYEYHNRTREYRLKEEIRSKVSYAIPKKIKWD